MVVLKGATETNIEYLLGQNIDIKTADLEELRNRIKWLKEKLDGFDINSIKRDAESFLSNRMTKILNCKRVI